MPGRPPVATSWDDIRSWEGQQSRAFEEICFQLRDPEPPGVELRKTDDPDAGFEWYWRCPGGTEIGWQCKFIADEKVLIGAMKASFATVAKRRPNARRITFCISRDFADDPDGARGKFGWQRFDEACVEWANEAPHIEVQLLQGGDLLERLARPEHRGRVWFWFGRPAVLDPEWCRAQWELARGSARERYRPDLNVELPIGSTLAAVAAPDDLRARFERQVTTVLGRCNQVLAESARSPAYSETATNLRDAAQELETDADVPWDPVHPLASGFSSRIDALCEVARQFIDAGHPVLLLLGQWFGAASPWPTLAEHLGDPGLGWQDICGALEAAAQATGKRAVLLIDAVNESADARMWAKHLDELQSRLTGSGWVSIGLTCRTTYLQAIRPKGGFGDNVVRVTHPGFQGREFEAVEHLFAAFDVEEPRVPLLLPEFTNPLFLILYCEAQARGRLPPGGAAHLTAVFTAGDRCARDGAGLGAVRRGADPCARRQERASQPDRARRSGSAWLGPCAGHAPRGCCAGVGRRCQTADATGTTGGAGWALQALLRVLRRTYARLPLNALSRAPSTGSRSGLPRVSALQGEGYKHQQPASLVRIQLATPRRILLAG